MQVGMERWALDHSAIPSAPLHAALALPGSFGGCILPPRVRLTFLFIPLDGPHSAALE